MTTLLDWFTTGILSVLLAMLSSGIATACAVGYIIGGALFCSDTAWGYVFIVLGVVLFPLSMWLRSGLHGGLFGKYGRLALWMEK